MVFTTSEEHRSSSTISKVSVILFTWSTLKLGSICRSGKV